MADTIHKLPRTWIGMPFGARQLTDKVDWGIESLGIDDRVWENGCRGEGVLVVIGDTGATRHRDCKEFEFAENFTSSRTVMDRNGHGQHVAGTVLAQDNGFGYVGAAPEAGYGVLKLLGDNGSNSTTNITRGYRWLIDWWTSRNADMRAKYHSCVLNLSLGGPPDRSTEVAIDQLWQAGIVVSAAMGNSGGSENQERGDAPGIYGIGVTAIDVFDRRASFSSVSQYADVACPGVNITSFGSNDSFVQMSGTSMATPYFTGVAALILASYRDQSLRTHDGLMEFLKSRSPFDLGRPSHDKFYGWGKPNLQEATISPLFNAGIPTEIKT